MANPSSKTTVTVGTNKFNALAVQVGATTLHDHSGLPQMGTMAFSISVTADMHDTKALPFRSFPAFSRWLTSPRARKFRTSKSSTGPMN